MKISFLRTFLVAADSLNISKTAVIRGVSQPAVSKQIKELEKALGCELFHRKKNRISLTDEGNFFISKAEQIVRIFDDGLHELRTREVLGNCVRIGASSTLGMLVLPEMLKVLTKSYPSVKISTEMKPVNELLESLKKNELDFCLLEGEGNNFGKDFIIKPAAECELVFIVPKGEFPAGKSELDVKELRSQTILFHQEGEGYDQTFCSYAKSNNITFEKKNNLPSLTAIKRFVENGLGFGCIPECLVFDEDMDNFECLTLKGHTIKYSFSICLCFEHKLAGIQGEMLQLSEEILKNMPVCCKKTVEV